MEILFESLRSERGCMSYLVGCESACRAAIVDPPLDLIERYQSLASTHGLQIDLAIETPTHPESLRRYQDVDLYRPLAVRLSPVHLHPLKLP